jgi:hypothetical protein
LIREPTGELPGPGSIGREALFLMRGLVLHRRVQRVFTETAESFLFNATPPRDFPSGALFIPTIPSTDHVNRPELRLDRVRIQAGGRRTLNLPRVLVADDNPNLLKAEIALLRSDFDVVGTAADGELW